jgi:DNA-binding NarL/FixJ family response regulator
MRVLIADDHPIVASGCRTVLADEPDIVFLEAPDAESAERIFVSEHPDICLIDINLPTVSGFELARRLLAQDAGARIIMFSMNDDPAFVVRAIEMGAQGYLSKSDDPRLFIQAVHKVAAGENYISPHLAEAVTFSSAAVRANPTNKMTTRELEILTLLRRGDKIAEIADALGISYKTVANTTSLLKQKLSAKNHSDLIRIAVEMNLG